MKKIIAFCFTIALLFSLSACAEKSATTEIFAMDTYMSLTAYGKDAQMALTDASRKINELERMLSRTVSDSDVAEINARHEATVSDETANLLTASLQ